MNGFSQVPGDREEIKSAKRLFRKIVFHAEDVENCDKEIRVNPVLLADLCNSCLPEAQPDAKPGNDGDQEMVAVDDLNHLHICVKKLHSEPPRD